MMKRCPFVATTADVGTALAFVSDANHCYSSGEAVPVSGIHQESYCLTAEYESCPVFQMQLREQDKHTFVTNSNELAEVIPLMPVELAPEGKRVSPTTIVLSLMMLVGLIAGWWMWRDFLAEPRMIVEPPVIVTVPDGIADTSAVSEQPVDPIAGATQSRPQATPTSSPMDEISGAAMIDLPIVPTTSVGTIGLTREAPATNLIATSPTPTPTATWDTGTLDQLANCQAPRWWVSHYIQIDDTLPLLASSRGVDINEVLNANCLESTSLSVGAIIMLPPVGVVVQLVASPTAVVVSRDNGSSLPTQIPIPVIIVPSQTPLPAATATPLPAATATDLPPEPESQPPTQQPQPSPDVAPTATPPEQAGPKEPTATPPLPPTPQVTRTPPAVP